MSAHLCNSMHPRNHTDTVFSVVESTLLKYVEKEEKEKFENDVLTSNVESFFGKDEETLLHLACRINSIKIVQLLFTKYPQHVIHFNQKNLVHSFSSGII